MSSVDTKILLIADESVGKSDLVTELISHNYVVSIAKDRASSLASFIRVNPVIVVIDLSVGQTEGFSICSEIRKNSNIPIIVLATKDQSLDEAIFLSAGVDDFLIKPINSEVLLLRLDIQKRHRLTSGVQYLGTYEADGLTLNLETREFSINGTFVSLTKIEFDFLRLLMEFPKRVQTRKQVFEAIGGSNDYSSDHLLDTHASRLRRKIKIAGGPAVISAVRGVGFRFSPGSIGGTS
jgi:DNA-binding response OmpR family regulator